MRKTFMLSSPTKSASERYLIVSPGDRFELQTASGEFGAMLGNTSPSVEVTSPCRGLSVTRATMRPREEQSGYRDASVPTLHSSPAGTKRMTLIGFGMVGATEAAGGSCARAAAAAKQNAKAKGICNVPII